MNYYCYIIDICNVFRNEHVLHYSIYICTYCQASARNAEDGRSQSSRPVLDFTNVKMVSATKARDLEAKLNAIITEFKERVDRCDKLIDNIQNIFRNERKLL